MRTPGVRLVLVAAYLTCLLLGGALVLVDELRSGPRDAIDHPAQPLTDTETERQVVGSAQQIVALARLRTTTAGYLPVSCKNLNDPPYQGTIYLIFVLPREAHGDTYFGEIAADLVGHGWTEGLAPAEHVFGRTLSKDGVTAVVHRHSDDNSVGVLRLAGPCRNINDHRHDTTGWKDITGLLTAIR
ncbi:hypothetical protein [Mycobacterium basiliense]|uniref:hypothetical protein n=1 Tax=Mycobacterium basiliense TaxID=2094119 RepID=UPI001E28D9F9|nr:hypothetical protein [Mycobacterium basiliense]